MLQFLPSPFTSPDFPPSAKFVDPIGRLPLSIPTPFRGCPLGFFFPCLFSSVERSYIGFRNLILRLPPLFPTFFPLPLGFPSCTDENTQWASILRVPVSPSYVVFFRRTSLAYQVRRGDPALSGLWGTWAPDVLDNTTHSTLSNFPP